jgi:hypothetical protein
VLSTLHMAVGFCFLVYLYIMTQNSARCHFYSLSKEISWQNVHSNIRCDIFFTGPGSVSQSDFFFFWGGKIKKKLPMKMMITAIFRWQRSNFSIQKKEQFFSIQIDPNHIFKKIIYEYRFFGQMTWYNPKQVGFDHCGT